MMRSLFSAVSGIRVHQAKMDVIANNISNVNTVGYKSSRVTFSETFSQTLSRAAGANSTTGRGGINPRQIGLGANVASIDKIMTQGAAQRTDNPFDLMIQGDTFFVVADRSGTYFTRAGAMDLDKMGNLVNPNGFVVQGWQAIPDPQNPGEQMISKGKVSNISIGPDKQFMNPKSTGNIGFEGNLNPTKDPTATRMMSFYDTLGNRYVVDVNFQFNATSGAWDYTVSDQAYPNNDRNNPVTLTLSPNTGSLAFDTNGMPVGTPSTPPQLDANGNPVLTFINPISVTMPTTLQPQSTAGVNGVINLDFADVRQFQSEPTSLKANTLDGNSSGTLSAVAVGPDGKISGRYSNGDSVLLGQIAVARFKNPEGLDKIGNNLFVATTNSGDFDGVGEEVQSGGGEMQSGVLEMSNVDLSSEFTEMITTQRGFQANTRVVTTSDDMLQELVNLKR